MDRISFFEKIIERLGFVYLGGPLSFLFPTDKQKRIRVLSRTLKTSEGGQLLKKIYEKI